MEAARNPHDEQTGDDADALRTELARLRDRVKQYRVLAESAPVGIFQVDRDGHTVFINERLLSMTGLSEADAAGLGWMQAIHPDDRERIRQAREAAEQSGREFHDEYRLLARDGTVRWVQENAAPYVDEYGRLAGYIGTVIDISDRKHIEARLRDEERLLWHFIEDAPAAIAMFDREMRYLTVSRRWLSDYGLEGQTIIGVSHYTIFPEIPDRWKAFHQRALAGEVIRAAEDPFVRLNGTVQWLRWEIRPWYDDTGAIGGILIFTEDITDLKNAEERLRRRNRALRLLTTTNEALIRTRSEAELIQRVCDIAVEAGGYRLAWVGYVESNADQVVQPAAHAGADLGYLTEHTFSWDESRPEGRGPLGQAIRTKRPVFADDFATAPEMTLWRDDALARGFRAGIVLPLITGDEVIGVFVLYRGEPYHFLDEETTLLMELADDLAYGLTTLRLRVERHRAEAALRDFARKTIEAATEGKLIICDADTIGQMVGPPLATWEICHVQDLTLVRHGIAERAKAAGMAEERLDDFLLCISEAATNACKHAGEGTATLHRVADDLIAVIVDHGPGIQTLNLPALALTSGYTTAVSLGMGYKAMISLADHVYLATGPAGTTVAIRMSLQPPPTTQTAFPGLSDTW